MRSAGISLAMCSLIRDVAVGSGGQETALLSIILSCCHMLHVDTISVL